MADSDVEEQEDESTIKDLHKSEKQILSSQSSNGWSMVIIKDYQEQSSIVFPPINHENLHLKPSIFTENLQKPPSESLTPCFSSSSSTLSSFSAENDDESNVSFSPMRSSDRLVGLESSPDLIRKKITNLASSGVMDLLYYGMEVIFRKVKWVFWSYFPSLSSAAFTAAVVLGYLYFRRRRRVVVREESRDYLNRIIREKDERINQLLNQIARMNEVMLALSRNSTTIKN